MQDAENVYRPPSDGWRTFLVVWVTQSISVLGSALTLFATTVWLTQELYARPEQRPELALALSAVTLASSIPVIFAAPLAGAWADRHDRRLTMLVADILSGIVSLLLALLMAGQGLPLWMLVGLMSANALLSSFHWSAFTTSYAMLVTDDQLPRANGMMQTMESLSGIVSPAIAATVIALPALARQGVIPGALGAALSPLASGAPLAITIDAVTFFVAGATLVFLSIPSPRRTDLLAGGKHGTSIWSDVRQGATYIVDRRPLLWLLGTFTVANFVTSPTMVLLPLFVKFNLVDDLAASGYTFETGFALLTTVASVGGVAGGLLISLWGGLRRRRVYGVLVPMIIAGATRLVLGFSPLLLLAAAMALVTHAMSPILNAHSQAIWQAQTPHELQGRVFAVRRLIAQFTGPIGIGLAGWAGAVVNPGELIALLGAVLCLFCIAQAFNPQLLRVEDRAWLESLAARKAAAG